MNGGGDALCCAAEFTDTAGEIGPDNSIYGQDIWAVCAIRRKGASRFARYLRPWVRDVAG